MDGNRGVRSLLVLAATLLGVVVGQVAGILAVLSGSTVAGAFVAAGAAFGGPVSFTIMIQKALGLL